jgi:hypothetical protein
MTETTPRAKIRARLHRPNVTSHNASSFLLQFDDSEESIHSERQQQSAAFAERWKIKTEFNQEVNQFSCTNN